MKMNLTIISKSKGYTSFFWKGFTNIEKLRLYKQRFQALKSAKALAKTLNIQIEEIDYIKLKEAKR